MAVTSNLPSTDMTNVSTIGNTTVMLDQLYTSYAEILNQAKSQLENVDVSEEHLGTIVQDLSNNTTFVNELAQILSRKIIRDMESDSSTILDAISKKVLASVERQLSEYYISQLVEATSEYTSSDEFKQAISTAIASNPDVSDTQAIRQSLKKLLAD